MDAATEAARCRRQQVGTPHLLLGLIADANGRPAEVLRSMGISILDIEDAVLNRLGRPAGRARRFRPSVSPQLRKVLDAAAGDAARASRHAVRAEDLLMALVADPGSKAARLVSRLQTRDQSVRTA
jgi:ATP-dependent Clp protease ATP-binding subunit ClpC